MAQVLPAERGLRRVIGDGDGGPDGDVDGLADRDLLELYRQLVLLRTYDERSVVYHRQGRIGTYAIFWGHEAMQAGSVYALERRRLDLPELPRVGDRPAARDAARRRCSPGGAAIRPAGGTRPTTTSRRSACRSATHVPHAAGLAWGKRLRGEKTCAIAYFGDGATSEGAFHEGANFAAVMRAPLVLFCNNNQWAISTPLEAQTRGRDARRQGGRLRDAGRARRRGRRARRLRGDARGGRARAGRRGPDVHRGGHLPRRAARDGGRPEGVHRPRARRGGAQRECVGRYEGYLRRRGHPDGRARREIRAEARAG